MIKAECWSDDRCVEVEFDATPWFEHATEQQVMELAFIGWRGDYPADAVADFIEERDTRIQEMKNYIGQRQKIETIGYECSVDSESALVWLKAHRPAWWVRILQEV